MKLIFATATALALTAGLAACGKPAPEQAAAPPEAATAMATSTTPAPAAPADDMGKMAMPADAKMAKGQGTVTAVDA
jgi:Cu(I)/Ag(I) efflux system protein CusF